MTTADTVLVETASGHCHGETIEALTKRVKDRLDADGISITRANGDVIWNKYVDPANSHFSMFPHNSKALSRLELNQKVFNRLYGKIE